jgi:dihydroorotate dehydrogenase (fumarate)
MADLSTNYMGFRLKNPIIASSSGLTDSIDKIVELEKHGVAAVVLKSLFEEQILMDVDAQRMNNIFDSYSEAEGYIAYYTRKNELNKYIELIDNAKQNTNIPIIASINCASAEQWTNFAGDVQAAGADGLELNVFILPSDPTVHGRTIEQIYLDVATRVSKSVSIPVALKVHHYFSGMANFMTELSNTGIKSLVLFNRFYQTDVDLEKMKVTSGHIFSTPDDNTMVKRWLSILSGRVNCDLAASTGIHNAETAIKNLLLGANAVQLASVIYQKGPSAISGILDEMNRWLDSKNFGSVQEIIGKLHQSDSIRPMTYERAQFMKYFSDVR